MTFFSRYPEVFPLAVNVIMTAIAIEQGHIGKATYWAGAAVLTVGILLMKG